jgi:AcrR family transcriptional regulator
VSNLSTTSDDILACARSLIVAGGYNGFSYADIAGVVGIRKASIHHHFPSKVDLVRTLVARYRKEAEASPRRPSLRPRLWPKARRINYRRMEANDEIQDRCSGRLPERSA